MIDSAANRFGVSFWNHIKESSIPLAFDLPLTSLDTARIYRSHGSIPFCFISFQLQQLQIDGRHTETAVFFNRKWKFALSTKENPDCLILYVCPDRVYNCNAEFLAGLLQLVSV